MFGRPEAGLMTEAEWRSSTHPPSMLRSLIGRYSARKRRGESPDFESLRRFACACLRRIWHLLDEGHRRSVEMIEEFARSPKPGGLLAARRVRRAAGNQAGIEYDRLSRAVPRDRLACLRGWARSVASSAVWQAADTNPARAANCHREVAEAVHSLQLAGGSSTTGPDPGWIGYELPADGEWVAQAALLREVTGNPFRPVTHDPRWRTETAVALATGIDAERASDRMPILADALEEAGCDHADILNHCRGEGVHVCGCWVVDLVLGKA